LVAEDNPVNQRVITGLLERQGLRAVTVADGESAVREALSGRFGLVLMDVHMPGLDGWAAARAIRAAEAGRRIPIVAMTARALEEDSEAAREAGMDAYLTKPVRVDELMKILRRFLPEPPHQGKEGEMAAQPQEQEVSYIDVKGALDRLGGDSALLAELAGLFLDEGPRLMAELDAALDQGDIHAAQNAAHQLKGLLAQFCAERQRIAAWEVELAARQADLVAARSKAAALRQLLDQLRPELRQLAGGGRRTA
jgi:CheY-like chemotaxis protein